MEKKNQTGRYEGSGAFAGVVRWDTKRKYTQEELAAQREEFSKEAEKGTVLCLSDLMINAGM